MIITSDVTCLWKCLIAQMSAHVITGSHTSLRKFQTCGVDYVLEIGDWLNVGQAEVTIYNYDYSDKHCKKTDHLASAKGVARYPFERLACCTTGSLDVSEEDAPLSISRAPHSSSSW